MKFLNDDAIEIEGIEYRRVRPRIEVPDWASIEFNVQSWWELLEDHNIDKTTRYNLFMLAQTSQDGAMEALDLIVKLQNKCGKHELDDPSRWLHSSSSKARARLTGRG